MERKLFLNNNVNVLIVLLHQVFFSRKFFKTFFIRGQLFYIAFVALNFGDVVIAIAFELV